MATTGIFSMLYILAERLLSLAPRLLDLLTTFSGGIVGELIVIILITIVIPPLCDAVYTLYSWGKALLVIFE